MDDLQRKVNQYKFEKLNSEGIGPDATLTVEIVDIEFLGTIKMFGSIQIKIRFMDQIKTTKTLSALSKVLQWKEKFVFKVESRDILYFDVINYSNDTNEENVLGSVQFDLSKMDNQDEYDVVLEIPDEDNDDIINSKINSRITFVWSNFQLYQEMLSRCERNVNGYKNLLDKSNVLIDNLNGIF